MQQTVMIHTKQRTRKYQVMSRPFLTDILLKSLTPVKLQFNCN